MHESGDWRSQKAPEYESFEWDESKQRANRAKHGIDFVDAAKALLEPHIVQAASKQGEQRHVAIATASGKCIAVIYTMRSHACRIISARIARRHERKAYQALLGREGQESLGKD